MQLETRNKNKFLIAIKNLLDFNIEYSVQITPYNQLQVGPKNKPFTTYRISVVTSKGLDGKNNYDQVCAILGITLESNKE